MTNTPLDAVRIVCVELGVTPPDSFTLDGKIQRYHDPLHDKPGVKDSWVMGIDNGDGTSGGTVGRWGRQSCNWHTGKTRVFSAEERAKNARDIAERRQKAEAEREAGYRECAKKAYSLWRKTEPASAQNEYLRRKKIKPHNARQYPGGDTLILDYRNFQGQITTLQFIKPSGEKKFLTGCQAKGSYHRIGLSPAVAIGVVEGFATGASVHEATGLSVAVAGSAANLLIVAQALRKKLTEIEIIIYGDRGKVGESSAREAAEAVNGYAIFPDPEPDVGLDHGR